MKNNKIQKLMVKFTIAMAVIVVPASMVYKLESKNNNYVKFKSEKNNNAISRKVEKVNYSEDNKNSVFFTCGLNGEEEPGFIPSNEGEQITSDTFCVWNNYIFLDDTTGTRILMYEDGKYVKELKLEWYQDVQTMYYSDENGTLSMVYQNLDKTDATYYYLMTMDIMNGNVKENRQISSSKKILLDYRFDEKGELQTNYLREESNDEESEVILGETLGEDYECEECFSDEENISVTICTKFDEKEDTVEECIVVSDDGKPESYIVPENHEYGLASNTIQMVGGNVYQMVVNRDEFTIYKLTQESIEDDNIETLNRDIINSQEKELKCGIVNLKSNLGDSNDTGNVIRTSSSSIPQLSSSVIASRINERYSCSWHYTPSNRTTSVIPKGLRSYVAAPSWLTGQYPDPTTSYSVTDIPYCWGGYTKSFLTQISNEYFAGNVNTSAGKGYISNTAGLDCSGFVSVVYKLPSHYNTTKLASCEYFTKRANKANVQEYDILDHAGSHVVIVTKVYTNNNIKYVDTVEESSTYGRIVKKTGLKYSSLTSDGFWPYKYANLN